MSRGALLNFGVLLGLVLALPALSGCVPYCPLDYCLCAVSSWGENWGSSVSSRRLPIHLALDLWARQWEPVLYPGKTQRIGLRLIDMDYIGGKVSIAWNPPPEAKDATCTISADPCQKTGSNPYDLEADIPAGTDGVDLLLRYHQLTEMADPFPSVDQFRAKWRGTTQGWLLKTDFRFAPELAENPFVPSKASRPIATATTRDVWIAEMKIFPKGQAGMTTSVCASVVNQMVSGTVFLGVRTPANPGDGDGGWSDPIVVDDAVPETSPVFEIQDRANPGSPIARIPLVPAPARVGWLAGNVPDANGMVWTALEAASQPSVGCRSGVNLSQNWDFYVRLPLDVTRARDNACIGCKVQLWFGGEGTNKTLANAVASAARQGIGAEPAAGESTGTVALGPVEIELGTSEGAGTAGLPLEITSSGVSSMFPPGSLRFVHTLQSRSSSSQTVTLSAGSRLGLSWGFYEGTATTPNLSKPITAPLALPANGAMLVWVVASVPSSASGSEVVTVSAASSLAPDTPAIATDAAQINKLVLPPAPAFTHSPASPVAGETVTFSNTTFGAATGWAWDFDDGGTSTSRNPSHVFAAGGRYEVVLTATNAGGTATTRRAVDVVPNRFVFPGVASAAGQNATDWRSEAVLFNPWSGSRSATLTLTNRGTGAVVASKGLTLGAGEVRAIADLYEELGAPAGAGALSLDGPVLAWVRTANLLGAGNPLGLPPGTTFGQDAVEIDAADAGADRSRYFVIHRPGSLATEFRSNLVLHNPGDAEVTLTLSVGAATATTLIPPKTYLQVNNVGQFVGAPNGPSVLRVRGNGRWSGTIATVDPVTGDPTTVRGLASWADGEALFPGVARAAGQNSTTWRSEAFLFNAGGDTVTTTLEILPRGSGTPIASKSYSLTPGELRSIPDVYGELGAPAGAGALRVSPGVLSWVRIYNQGVSGTFGQDAVNVSAEYFEPDDAVAFPVRTAADLGTEFRSNLVLVNGGSTPLTFTLAIGGLSKTQEVPAGAYAQVNHVGAFVGAPVGGGLLVVSAPGRWAASVATIDPFSGDPTTVRGIPLP